MTGGDDRDVHGVDPRFGGFVDSVLALDETEVTMQIVHRRKRGAHVAQCGDTIGQLSVLGTGITCPKCLARSSAGKRRAA